MKNLTSQHGHLHIGLLVVAVITMVSMTGYSIYNKQSNASAETPEQKENSPACLALYDLSYVEYDALSDAVIFAACGPNVIDDPALADPCDSEEYEKLPEEEYDRRCPFEPPPPPIDHSNDAAAGAIESTDGEKTPINGSTNRFGSNQGTSKISLVSKQACISSLGQLSLLEIKAYGNERIKERKKDLTNLNKSIANKNFDSVSAKNLKARVNAANARVKAAEKKSNSGKKVAKIKVKIPKSHVKIIKKDIKAYGKKLTTAKSDLKASTTTSQATSVTCSAIFDTRIYSYLIPKIDIQQKIDGLSAQTTAYDINSQANSAVRKLKGTTAKSSSSASPAILKSRIANLQKSLDATSINSKANNYALFNSKLNPEYKAIRTELKNNYR